MWLSRFATGSQATRLAAQHMQAVSVVAAWRDTDLVTAFRWLYREQNRRQATAALYHAHNTAVRNLMYITNWLRRFGKDCVFARKAALEHARDVTMAALVTQVRLSVRDLCLLWTGDVPKQFVSPSEKVLQVVLRSRGGVVVQIQGAAARLLKGWCAIRGPHDGAVFERIDGRRLCGEAMGEVELAHVLSERSREWRRAAKPSVRRLGRRLRGAKRAGRV